jgi:hypothetical protein
MRRSFALASPSFLSLVALGGVVATPASGGVDFQGLGFLPGGTYSFARGISGDGSTVVGNSEAEAFR